MPNRIVREGLVDSEAVSKLSDWAHRVYTHLLVKVDDAGRFDGRLEFIRSHLFPLGTDRRISEIEAALNESDRARLLIRYKHNSKPFLQLTKWYRCGNATTSKFPWEDGGHVIKYVQMETRDGKKECVETSMPSISHRDEESDDSDTNTDTKTDTKTTISSPKVDGFDLFWQAYPRKVGKGAARRKWERIEMTADLLEKILVVISEQTKTEQWLKDGGQFIPHPVTWLNQERWNDEVFIAPNAIKKFSIHQIAP